MVARGISAISGSCRRSMRRGGSPGVGGERQKQAAWRTDPAKSGLVGDRDIGTHAFHLACFVRGCPEAVWRSQQFVPGGWWTITAHVLLRFAGGASG